MRRSGQRRRGSGGQGAGNALAVVALAARLAPSRRGVRRVCAAGAARKRKSAKAGPWWIAGPTVPARRCRWQTIPWRPARNADPVSPMPSRRRAGRGGGVAGGLLAAAFVALASRLRMLLGCAAARAAGGRLFTASATGHFVAIVFMALASCFDVLFVRAALCAGAVLLIALTAFLVRFHFRSLDKNEKMHPSTAYLTMPCLKKTVISRNVPGAAMMRVPARSRYRNMP